jgi:hypothetical protein
MALFGALTVGLCRARPGSVAWACVWRARLLLNLDPTALRYCALGFVALQPVFGPQKLRD